MESRDDKSDEDWCEDGFGDGYDVCELSRERERRQNQFRNIGYRDGLIAGKEASAQESFVDGFKQSVLLGHDWGFVRDITSAMDSLPDHLKDKWAGTAESKSKFKNLCESVQSLSMNDALKLFYDSILSNETKGSHYHPEGHVHATIMEDEGSGTDQLGSFSRKVKSLLYNCSAIRLC